MNTLHIILGNQHFPLDVYKKTKSTHFFMAEDSFLASRYKYHKIKIAFFFISMRRYRDELTSKKLSVDYHELCEKNFHLDFFTKLNDSLKKLKTKKISIFEVEDKFFEKLLNDFVRKNNIEITVYPSPLFLVARSSFQQYLKNHKKPFLKTFYEGERKKFSILMDNGTPIGGHYSFDSENRKKLPKSIHIPAPKYPNPINIPHFENVTSIINQFFPDHPGDLNNFWLPTTRSESLKWLKRFIDERLNLFGDYQDAMTNQHDFLFHSGISSLMNSGLIVPQEVISQIEKAYLAGNCSLNSAEGFIRQVLGWREFVRGIYQNFSEKEESTNFFNHQRKLTQSWYDGTTGIVPLDFAIKRTIKYGHTHHIERLMVISNIMLLCEIDPHEVHKWFMELFVDSSDWVMGPNVYGMGQFSDGGIFATKPYICGSNYILKMSDYQKGSWCETMDALYWSFIYKKRTYLVKNPRLSMMAKTVEKMDQKKIAKHLELADNFIKTHTK